MDRHIPFLLVVSGSAVGICVVVFVVLLLVLSRFLVRMLAKKDALKQRLEPMRGDPGSPAFPAGIKNDQSQAQLEIPEILSAAPPLPPAVALPPQATGAFRSLSPPFETVRIFYATDRKNGGFKNAADFYLNDRNSDRTISWGICEVSIPGGERHKIGRLESPSIWRLEFHEDPAKHIVLLGAHAYTKELFFSEVQKRVADSAAKEAFVFIHGYNVSFEDAARRTGQLAYDLQFEGAPILYSWPSRAETKAYPVDETNVNWTVPQLRTFLFALAALSGARVIHLIAHSMGNRALVSALHDIALEVTGGSAAISLPLFRHVVLTAPDIDADTFCELAGGLRSTAHNVTLYACKDDVALALSRTFHGYRRAGDSIVIVPGIDVIDASAVDTSLLHHSYFAGSRSVISDLYSLLKTGQPPASRFGMSEVSNSEGKYYVFRP